MKKEEKVRALLRHNYPNEQVLYNYRPEWLKNPKTGYLLELDIYYPEKNFAVEIQGLHHQTLYQKYKDGIKIQVCKDRGIDLYCLEITSKAIKRFIAKYNLDYRGILKPSRFSLRTPRKNSWASRYVSKVTRQLKADHHATITDIQKKETERIRNSRLLQNMRESPL